jgi:surface antigen
MAGKSASRYLSAGALAVAFSIAGCSGNEGTKETVGTLTGGALGGLLGAQIGHGDGQLAATAAGALAGAYIGNQIGKGLDEVDRYKAAEAQSTAASAPVGETVTWNNPETGHYGSVTPTREGTSASSRYCREFQHTIYVDGEQQQAYGTTCRQPDGSWEVN